MVSKYIALYGICTFLQQMLGKTENFGIVQIEKIERPEKIVRIYLD